MAAIDEKLVARVVGEVLTRLSTQPSASAAPSQTAFGVYEDMNAAVEANVRYQMKTLLARSEILRKAQAEGKLTVLGGIYDVDTGAVRFLD